MEHYAHTALMDMLTTAATGPDLAGVLGSLSCQRPVMDALIEGMGPVVSMLLQVTLGLGGRAAAGTVSLGSAEDELRISGRDLMRAVLQAVVNAASAAQERVPGGVDGPDGVRRPLRPRPLDRTRELRYRGPWRLPGPDSHRLAAASLTPGYDMTTPFVSRARATGRTWIRAATTRT